ncbi:hypothetical protein BGZ73_004707 [Actinomortierella ambigua]|nr:hypothetical protein BGZ73_004707 [Actinomortierella ambigua]
MFADPDQPYANGEPYPTEDASHYVDQILDPQAYSSGNHEEEADGDLLLKHVDISVLEEEDGDQVEGDEEPMGGVEEQELSGAIEDLDGVEDLVYEEEDDGSAIDEEPEDDDMVTMDDDSTRDPEIFDASSHSGPIHHHLLNTGSSSESDIWNEAQDLLTDDDFIELDDDYATIVSHDTEKEAAAAAATSPLTSQEEEQPTQGHPPPLSQSAPSIIEKLDPGTQYLTYLPYAGIANQFYGMLRALMLAKALGRTLIIPPITASSHDKPGRPQPWSTYFDIGTFTYLTNVKVVEMQDLKNLPIITEQSPSVEQEQGATGGPDGKKTIYDHNSQLLPALEPLSCLQTGGFGSRRPLDFTAHEHLRQWGFDLTMYSSEYSSELDVERLAKSIQEDERNQQQQLWKNSGAEASPAPSRQLLCITNAHKISVPKGSEWDQYGRHFYFSPALERFYVSVMDKLREDLGLDVQNSKQQYQHQQEEVEHPSEAVNAPLSSNHPQPHSLETSVAGVMDPFHETREELYATQPISFISIHARRDDFVDYCNRHFSPDRIHTCLPSTEHLAATLSRLQARNPLLRHLPVLVSTNERRPEELAKFQRLGWHVVDEFRLQSEEKLGGIFGPMMVDQILMARARLLIGVRASTFSRVGALRQMDWYNRRSFIL